MDDVVRETLRFVNSVRASRGDKPLKKLRKGVRLSACCCPVARSIELDCKAISVGLDKLFLGSETGAQTLIDIPGGVQYFIWQFDGKRYPEYIYKNWKSREGLRQ